MSVLYSTIACRHFRPVGCSTNHSLQASEHKGASELAILLALIFFLAATQYFITLSLSSWVSELNCTRKMQPTLALVYKGAITSASSIPKAADTNF
jgi:hypothetical protein